MALVVMAARAFLRGHISYEALPLLWAPVVLHFLIPLELPALKLGLDVSTASLRSGGSWQSTWIPQSPMVTLATATAGHPTAVVMATALWASGSLVAIGVFAMLYTVQAQSIGTGIEPASPKAADWLACHQLRRNLVLRESSAIRTPIARGFLRPSIFVPCGFFDQPDPTIVSALEHEFAHVRRFDPAFRQLVSLTVCAFWFDPILWLARRMVTEDQELACDAAAIARLGDALRETYALTLLNAAEAARQPRVLAAAFKQGPLETRIMAIIQPVHSPTRTAVASVAVLALALGAIATTSVFPEARVGLGCYSFSIPSYWNGKVDIRVTEDTADICLPGNPDLVLVSFARTSMQDLQWGTATKPSRVLWSGTGADGSLYQMRGPCYAEMTIGDRWRTTPFSTPAYPGLDIARLAVDLSSGGSISAEEAASWTEVEGHDVDGFLRQIASSIRAA